MSFNNLWNCLHEYLTLGTFKSFSFFITGRLVASLIINY